MRGPGYVERVLRQLEALPEREGDVEVAHYRADQLVAEALGVLGGDQGKRILAAVERLKERVGGWYYA